MSRRAALLAAALLALAGAPARAADTAGLYREAIKLYEKGDYDKALKGFLKVMRMDPGNAEAREYMLRCSQKIVESKLGTQAADNVEKEIDADKAAQEISDAPPALSEDYMTPIQPAAQAAAAGAPLAASSVPPMPAEPSADVAADIRAAAAAAPSNARDLLAERSALADDLRRRHLGKGNIVDIVDTAGKLEVTFYLNRLFMPLSDALKPEAFAVLNDIRDAVQSSPKREVVFNSVDSVSPAVRHTMADLSVRRTNVVFSYILHATYAPPR